MADARRHWGGLAAEEIAERAYLAQGAVVQARRWRAQGGRAAGAGEIDLILRLGSMVVFAEVKARRQAGPDSPVRPGQWARIGTAAALWLQAHQPSGLTALRFDAVLIDGLGRAEILTDAWRPDW
ncbi:MAG: YraN family protein [Pikeienuella sp.]